MAADGYTTIMRTLDPAQGELVAEMLRREGIDARFHRVSSTLIGLPETLIEMTVDVPAEMEPRARDLLAELEYVGAAEAAEQEDDESFERGRNEAGRAPRPRPPFLAAGFAVVFPGGAHLYARRPWTALVLALGLLWFFAILVSANMLELDVAFAAIIAIVACDAVAGVRAAREERDGKHVSGSGQFARGLGLLVVGALVGAGVRAAAEVPGRVRAWRLSKYEAPYKVSCTRRSITIENHSGKPCEIEIAKLEIAPPYLFEEEDRRKVGIVGPRFLTVAPGGRGTATVAVPDAVARACHFSALGAAPVCDFSFAFAARKLDGVDDEPYETHGSCVPSNETGGEVPGRLDPPP